MVPTAASTSGKPFATSENTRFVQPSQNCQTLYAGPPEGDCELSTESSQSLVCMQIVEGILKVFGLDVASRSRSSTRRQRPAPDQ